MEKAQLNIAVPQIVSEPRPIASQVSRQTKADKRISTYRLAMGWLGLVFWTIAIIGIDWDVQWHELVGRDGFWTPPHWMFYSCVTATGLVCLIEFLIETFMFHRKQPGVNERTTTPVLFFFHGPVGFALAGFGMVVMLISAPFDDYYHRIYGIDVLIWTPFHVMLLLGMLMTSFGLVYAFASEITRRYLPASSLATQNLVARLKTDIRSLFNPAILGFLIAGAILISRYMGVFAETLIGKAGQIGTFTIFGVQLPAYSLVLATLPVILVAYTNFTKRIGATTALGLLFLLYRTVTDLFSRWGIETLGVGRGLALRQEMGDFVFITSLMPIFLPLAGLAVDLIYLAMQRRQDAKNSLRRRWLTAMAASLAAALILYLLDRPWETYLGAVRDIAAQYNPFTRNMIIDRMVVPAYWQALPLVLLIGIGAGLAGLAWAASLRYTDR